jgi:hypothetical protein
MFRTGNFNKLWISLMLLNNNNEVKSYSGKVGEHLTGVTTFNNIVDDEETQKQEVFPATSSDVYCHQVFLSYEENNALTDSVKVGDKTLNIRDQKINKVSTLVNFNNSTELSSVSVDINEYVVTDMGSFTGSTYRYEFPNGGDCEKIHGVPVSNATLLPVSNFETFKKRINIVIIPGQGYSNDYQSLFHSRAIEVIGYFNTPEYPIIRDYLDKFNFIIWERELTKTTLGNNFGLVNHSYLNGLYLEDASGTKLEDTDVDQIILLTLNEKTQAYGLPWLTPTDDGERFSYVNIKNGEEETILHELGHSFCGMHDEYTKGWSIHWGYYLMAPYLYNVVKVNNNLNGEHFKFVEEVIGYDEDNDEISWLPGNEIYYSQGEKNTLEFWAKIYYTGYNWISFNRGGIYCDNGVVRSTLTGIMREPYIVSHIYNYSITPVNGYNYLIQLHNRTCETSDKYNCASDYSLNDFKREYPPYLKWGGKYININKPTLLDNGFNSATNEITISYDWCYMSLPPGTYNFEISLYSFEDNKFVISEIDTLHKNFDVSLGYESETYHVNYGWPNIRDFLQAGYWNNRDPYGPDFTFDISSKIDEINPDEYYQIKIKVIKIGGWSNEEQKRGFEKVYTTFSQPFKIN